MSNPYNKRSEEQLYLSWDHGANADSKEDNPYTPDDGKVFEAWNRGWNANKKGKKAPKVEVEKEYGEEFYTLPVDTSIIPSLDMTICNLKLIADKELQELIKQKEAIDKRISILLLAKEL